MEDQGIIQIPQNEDAEQAVLLSCLVSEMSLYLAMELCTESDFYNKKHKEIFNSIKSLVSDDSPVDRTTVANILSDESKVLMNNLFSRTDVSPDNVDKYCEILQEHTKLRLALEASYSIQRSLRATGRNANSIIENAEDLLFKAFQRRDEQSFVTPSDILEEIYTDIKAKIGTDRNTVIGLTTTIGKIDNISYGFEKQTFTVVAGRPSMGKTEFVLQAAGSNALKGFPVAIFSLEQPKEELLERIIAQIAEVDLRKIKRGWLNKSDIEKYFQFFCMKK